MWECLFHVLNTSQVFKWTPQVWLPLVNPASIKTSLNKLMLCYMYSVPLKPGTLQYNWTNQSCINATYSSENFFEFCFVMLIDSEFQMMYFITRKLLGFSKCCWGCNCSKTTHYAQNYLFDFFIVFLLCYSLKFFQQSLQAALHFCVHKCGSRPFSKWRDMHSLDAHEALYTVFWL